MLIAYFIESRDDPSRIIWFN